MITADPLGRALKAVLSRGGRKKRLRDTCFGATLTGLSVSDVALWEASEVQVKALVNVANVLLEVGFDLGKLE